MGKIKKKLISLVLAFELVFTMLSGLQPVQASTGGHTANDAIAWANSQVGKALDYDGYYGAQCADFIAYYCQYLGVSPIWGNAIDYTSSAIPAGWQRLQGAVPQKGDILVYTNSPYGHVAIFESTNVTYHQNYGRQYVQKITNVAYNRISSYWGVIRPDFKLAPEATTPPTVSEGQIIGADEGGYMIQCKVTGEAVSSVKVASWVDGNGQGDLKWGDMVRQTDGVTYKYYVTYSDHGNIAGNYQNHIYAYNSAGEGVLSVYFDKPDSPTVSEGQIIDADGSGYTIQCRVAGEAISSVKVASWIDGNGQGDLKWGDMVRQTDGVTYKYYVAYSDHGNIAGNYQNHIYAYNSVGKGFQSVFFCAGDKPEVSDIHIVDADSGGYMVECKIDSYNILSAVQVATWTTNNGQDDIQKKNLERQSDGLTYRCYIPYSDHNNEKGPYENLISAKSITGEESQVITYCNELHNWNAGIVLKEATCYEPGLKKYTCTVCNETKTEKIPAAHKEDSGTETKQPTETETGIRTYKCSICQKVLRTEKIAKLPSSHKHDEKPGNSTKPDNSASTADPNKPDASDTPDKPNASTGPVNPTGKPDASDTPNKPDASTNPTNPTDKPDVTGETSQTGAEKPGTSGKNENQKPVTSGGDSQTGTDSGGRKIIEDNPDDPTWFEPGNDGNDNLPEEVFYNVEWNVSSAVLQLGKSTSKVKAEASEDDDIDKYLSSDTSIVTVNDDGIITAKGIGKAVVRAVTEHGCTADVVIKVQKKAVVTKKIKSESKNVQLKVGKTHQLGVQVMPITSSQKIIYKSSNPKIVAVNSQGKIKAKKAGVVTIKARSGKKTVKIKVTVK